MAAFAERHDEGLSRRELLRRAGVGATAALVGGGAAPYAFAGPLKYTGRWLAGDLSIVQWRHVLPAYDAWLATFAKTWGQQNDVQVAIDHVPSTSLAALAATESSKGKGHDVFGFLSPPAAYESKVIDHAAIVAEVERKVGLYGELGRNSTYNPRTKRYFGVSDSYIPDPVIWRHDLWNGIGESPATWEHVRRAAPTLESLGHPIGIGQSNELDSNTALIAFLMCFGSFVQDERNVLAIDNKRTVEAVRFMADLYRNGQTEDIFGWDQASNNEFLLGGRGSMILNAISAVRTAETVQLPFVDDLWIWPVPQGPNGRHGLAQFVGVYSIWKFAKNKAAAQRFVADLCINYKQAALASRFLNFPSFPGAFPMKQIYGAAAADTHPPRGKYTILTTIAWRDTRNAGYPGQTNAAVAETLDRFLIPKMFAQVSQGKTSATDSVRSTAAEMKAVWAKWKAAGKV